MSRDAGTEGRIRVLHVLPFVLHGGVERRRLLLARFLGERFEQRVACLITRGPIEAAIRESGTEVLPLSTRGAGGIKDVRAHLRLARLVREYRPHIVHAAIFEGMFWGGIAGLLQRVPVVLLEETSNPDTTAPQAMQRSARARRVVRLLARASDGVVAVAPRIRDFLVTEQGISPDRVHLIMNGVARFDLAPRSEALEARRELGLHDDAFVLGGVGRVDDKHKRFSDLIDVVARLRARHHVQGVVVGDGADRVRLEALVRERGLAEHFVFAGRREDRALFFSMMDAFVLSSATEAAPLALMEAMMAGLPCVATSVGGVPDIAQDEVSALVTPPYRPELLAEAVERLITDDGLRRRLSEAARARAQERFTEERYVGDVRALYDRLLGDGRSRRGGWLRR